MKVLSLTLYEDQILCLYGVYMNFKDIIGNNQTRRSYIYHSKSVSWAAAKNTGRFVIYKTPMHSIPLYLECGENY